MLKFFGDGCDFDVKRGNSNAFFINGDELILFDCGSKLYFELIENNLLNGIKNITIFITHLHAGHVAGLPQLCDYLNVQRFVNKMDINFNIFYPNTEKIKTLLSLTHIINPEEHLYKPEESKYVKKIFVQKHVDGSFGYLFEINKKKIYFSGDAAEINKDALQMLIDNKIDYFYHEACEKTHPLHVCIDKIIDDIPKNLRNKVYLMHISDGMVEKIKQFGFNLCKTIKK